MNDTISRGWYWYMAAWVAAILLLYVVFGVKCTGLLERYRSETDKIRTTWIAASTESSRAAALEKPAQKGSGPVDVHTGIQMNRFGEFSLVESGWTADFDIWFRWNGGALNPGETFDVANGEILQRQRKQSVVRGAEHTERYRVMARIAKSFDPARFPFSDEGLVIVIEDTQHGAGALRYVADTGIVDIPGLPTFRAVRIKQSFLFVNLARYDSAPRNGSTDSSASMNSRLIFAMLAKASGFNVFARLFQALFASVAVALVVFFIRPSNGDARFGLSVGAFFAAVSNNIYVASQLPSSDRLTLSTMVNAVGLITIFLVIVESVISLYMHDSMKRERLSLVFDCVSFVAILIGYVAVNVMLPIAACS